jgi:hypothetical protein
MSKEIHIWLGYVYPKDVAITYNLTLARIKEGHDRIDTTIPEFCSSKFLDDGYKLFAHMVDGEEVEIIFGSKNKNTDREIRSGHNLCKMLLANEFGLATLQWWQ